MRRKPVSLLSPIRKIATSPANRKSHRRVATGVRAGRRAHSEAAQGGSARNWRIPRRAASAMRDAAGLPPKTCREGMYTNLPTGLCCMGAAPVQVPQRPLDRSGSRRNHVRTGKSSDLPALHVSVIHPGKPDLSRHIIRDVWMGGAGERASRSRAGRQGRWGVPCRAGSPDRGPLRVRLPDGLRLIGTREEAQDVAQDVCVKLAGAVRSFRGNAEFSTWLYRVAYNTAIDHIRARERLRRGEGPTSSCCSRQDRPVGRDRHGRQRALERGAELPPQQRDAVILVYAEDLTHAEAAAIMGCTEKTVSWHLHEARKRLRARLDAVG